MSAVIPLFPQKNWGAQGGGTGAGGTGQKGATGPGTSYWQDNSNVLSPFTTADYVVIGSTAAGLTGKFQVTGDVYISGTCIAQQFNAWSDYRIKENIVSIDLSTYSIDTLKPVIYNHKTDGSTNIGFLAHEVQEYFPFLVSGSKGGLETQSINYIGLIALLTKEIQELKKRVSQLEKNWNNKYLKTG